MTNQNLQKSKIEFQTKFCDESRLNANIDELESSMEQSEAYIQHERMLSKQLIEQSTFEPHKSTLKVTSDDLKKRSKLHRDVYTNLFKSYIDKRLAYRCAESDMIQIKYFLDNFDTLLENFTQEKLNQGSFPLNS